MNALPPRKSSRVQARPSRSTPASVAGEGGGISPPDSYSRARDGEKTATSGSDLNSSGLLRTGGEGGKSPAPGESRRRTGGWPKPPETGGTTRTGRGSPPTHGGPPTTGFRAPAP